MLPSCSVTVPNVCQCCHPVISLSLTSVSAVRLLCLCPLRISVLSFRIFVQIKFACIYAWNIKTFIKKTCKYCKTLCVISEKWCKILNSGVWWQRCNTMADGNEAFLAPSTNFLLLIELRIWLFESAKYIYIVYLKQRFLSPRKLTAISLQNQTVHGCLLWKNCSTLQHSIKA